MDRHEGRKQDHPTQRRGLPLARKRGSMTGSPYTNISRDEHFKHMQELMPYIDLMTDADEFEQSTKALCEFREVNYLSEEFKQAYCQEIKAILEWLKDNVRIKKGKRKVITTVSKHKYLEYVHE